MTVDQLKNLRCQLQDISWLKGDPDSGAKITHFLLNPFERPPGVDSAQYKHLAEVASETVGAMIGRFCSEGTQLLNEIVVSDVPYPKPAQPQFQFIDLFAGIGGFRIAFQDAGGECVFTSEWDRFAKQTYERNFGEEPYGDITQIDEQEIPQHDVLCAGFPCQPFSLAGVSKKNSLGRKHGFEDETQGTLFFDIKRILNYHRPKAFMLENVKNLRSHDQGKTFEVIRKTLEGDLGYVVAWKIVNGANWVPQKRERIFIVGYDPDQVQVDKEEIIIPESPENDYAYHELRDIIQERVDGYTLGPGTWDTLVRHKASHEEKGNGFGYGLHELPISEGAYTRTISARYHKDGAEVLIEQPGTRPRKLTIREAMQLQGYDLVPTIFQLERLPVCVG